jgi:hypothetical protein
LSNASRLQRELEDIEYELGRMARQIEQGADPQALAKAVRRIRSQFDDAMRLVRRIKQGNL